MVLILDDPYEGPLEKNKLDELLKWWDDYMDNKLENAEKGPLAGGPKPEPIEHIIQFFSFAHLKEPLQRISRPFCELALEIVDTLPRNPERTVVLRKLLEAKDAAVRASIAK